MHLFNFLFHIAREDLLSACRHSLQYFTCNILQEGLARLEKRRRWEPVERKQVIDELEKDQEEARTKRLGMWEYGDIMSDDEDTAPVKKTTGKR